MGISLTPITDHKQTHLYTLRQNDFGKNEDKERSSEKSIHRINMIQMNPHQVK